MYKVDISNKGGYSFGVTSEGYRFDVDTEGKGVPPMAALLASVGSCIGVYIRKYAEGAKLELGGFDIKVEADLSKEKPVSFREMRVSIDLKGFKLEENRRESLLRFVKNCPVHNTLKIDPAVNISIT